MKFHAVYSNAQGDLFADDHLQAVGSRGAEFIPAAAYIPLPSGATLTSLPGRTALGLTDSGELATVHGTGERWAVGALLPQGFTRTLLPAARREDGPEVLPLLGYTAAAMDERGHVWVAALQTDEHRMWHPRNYNTPDLPGRIVRVKKRFPNNRIISQLARCSRQYGCFTAQNVFYRRFEGGLPVSPTCNARCLGCISLQESQCCPSAQGRIDFRPTVREGTEVALYHLTGKGENPIISFGQGCEGDPSLADKTVCGIIRHVRLHTERGIININTNGGATKQLCAIVDSGLDAMRTSLISAVEEHYTSYYRPRNYCLADVENSVRYAVDHGVYVSLNLLTQPGFTDRADEIEALSRLIRRTGLQKVQIRNLNIDDDWFYDQMKLKRERSEGIPALLHAIEQAGAVVGNYTTRP